VTGLLLLARVLAATVVPAHRLVDGFERVEPARIVFAP